MHQPFPIARYQFTARALEPIRLPLYAGSLLRGIFGAALRRTSCMTKLTACPGCPLYRSCPYPAIFETPPRPTALPQQFNQIPNPYVIEPPALGTRRIDAGDPLRFNMVLVGDDTLRNLPLIIYSWQRALQSGLGSQRARAVLEAVHYLPQSDEPELVWQPENGNLAKHQPEWIPPPIPQDIPSMTLHIVTPLRLQSNGHALSPRALNASTLAKSALRRVTLMLDIHCGRRLDHHPYLETLSALTDDRSALHWQDWQRYSSRQQRDMTLGGVVGAWTLAGSAVQNWYTVFTLGEWLHLGKNATMGMGGYQLRVHGRETSESSTNFPQAPSQAIDSKEVFMPMQ